MFVTIWRFVPSMYPQRKMTPARPTAMVATVIRERRLFRREYGPEKLPLYEAYAAIWASDDLQYHGGGTAHASAYNYWHNAMAARVARALGRDGAAYERENRKALDQLEREFKRGEISKEEYLKRKKEIEERSAVR